MLLFAVTGFPRGLRCRTNQIECAAPDEAAARSIVATLAGCDPVILVVRKAS